MKPLIRLPIVSALTLCAALWAMSGAVHAQIFVTSVGSGAYTGTIGEYNLDGSTINASLVSGLAGPYGLAESGGDLYVANLGDSTIDEYTTAGAPVNAPYFGLGPNNPTADIAVSGGDVFVSSLHSPRFAGIISVNGAYNAPLVSELTLPYGFAVSGGHIFVANYGQNGWIGEYTTSGATVNATLISGLNGAWGIAVSGEDLFVADEGNGTIYKYTTSGAFVGVVASGLSAPTYLTVAGGDLYVVNDGSDTVGEYGLDGTVINASLISGLDTPYGIAVVVPEPSTLALAGFGGLSLLWFLRRRK